MKRVLFSYFFPSRIPCLGSNPWLFLFFHTLLAHLCQDSVCGHEAAVLTFVVKKRTELVVKVLYRTQLLTRF